MIHPICTYNYTVFLIFFKKAKRIRPDEDAKFWCQAGLDKDGFEKRFINNTIGINCYLYTYRVRH